MIFERTERGGREQLGTTTPIVMNYAKLCYDRDSPTNNENE